MYKEERAKEMISSDVYLGLMQVSLTISAETAPSERPTLVFDAEVEN